MAATSGLSVATIRKLELGHISPRESTTDVIRRAFENAGLEFIEPGGVRHRPEEIKIYQGHSGACDFFDDVYHTAKTKGGECLILYSSAKKFFISVLGEYHKVHVERMTAIRDVYSVRCILSEDEDVLPAATYCEYRWLSKKFVDAAPFYVYDDKYAMIVTEADPSPKIIVIQSRAMTEALRHQFYSLWEKASPLNTLETKVLPLRKR